MKISTMLSIIFLGFLAQAADDEQPFAIISTSVKGIPHIVDTNNLGTIRVNNMDGSSKSVSFGVKVVGVNQIEVDEYTRKFALGTEIKGLAVKLVRAELTADGSHACMQHLGEVVSGSCETLVAVVVPKGYGATVLGKLVGISTDKEVVQAAKAKTITDGQARLLAQVMADANGDYDREKLAKDFAIKIITPKQLKISANQMGTILNQLNYDSKKMSTLALFVNYLADRQATVPVVRSLLTGSDKDRAEKLILGLSVN